MSEVEGTLTVRDGYLILDSSGTAANFGPEVHLKGKRGGWFTGIDVAHAIHPRDFVIGQLLGFAISDAVLVAGSPTLCSPAQAGFQVGVDIGGFPISGPGILPGTTILEVLTETTALMSLPATATGTGVEVRFDINGVEDIIYAHHRGLRKSLWGFGQTPPLGGHRWQFAGIDSEPELGIVGIRCPDGTEGNALTVYDGNGDTMFAVGPDGSLGDVIVSSVSDGGVWVPFDLTALGTGGWDDLSPGAAGYKRYVDGTVGLRGKLANGTNESIAAFLPDIVRPAVDYDDVRLAGSYDLLGTCHISASTGEIRLHRQGNYVSLDGIRFDTA